MSDKCALVVDDDLAIRRLLVATFVRRGVAVDEASDGDLAIEMLSQKEYNVVLLDLMMPKVSGFEVLRRMDESGSATPVIVLSAASQKFLEKVDSKRVKAVVRKPFDLNELVLAVLELCDIPVPEDLHVT